MAYRLRVAGEIVIECDQPEEAWRLIGLAAAAKVEGTIRPAVSTAAPPAPARPFDRRSSPERARSPAQRDATTRRVRLLEAIRALGGHATVADLRRALGSGWQRERCHNDLQWGLAHGMIQRTDTGVYALTSQGPQLVIPDADAAEG